MLAAVYDGSSNLRLVERDRPRPGPHEAVLKVEACGLCGTDLRILSAGHARIPPGTERVLGHELAGVVAEVGAEVDWLTPGMRVAIAPNTGCGRCELCLQGETQLCPGYLSFGVGLDGGLAEYMRLPRQAIEQGNVVELPDGLSFEAAALNEPLSCVYRGLTACRLSAGESVLVVGAGPIGLMFVQLARALGAGLILVSSRNERRSQMAAQMGADHIIDPRHEDLAQRVLALTHGRGVDIAVVAAPSAEAQAQCVAVLAHHGRLNFFGGLPSGLPAPCLDTNRVHYRELTLTGTTGQTVRQYRTTLQLMASGKVDPLPLISDRFRLAEAGQAVERARSRAGLKVMVFPGQGSLAAAGAEADLSLRAVPANGEWHEQP